jgi:predicted  nucleic acid-binding Zn-ribbon protein
MKISRAREAKDLLVELQKDFKKFAPALLGGSKFRQYEAGKKVMKRYLRLIAPKGMGDSKEVAFESIVENPTLRVAISSKTSLISMINIADIVAIFPGKRDAGKCFPKAEDEKALDESVAPEDNCFVIVTKKRTVGLEAKTKFLRDFWVAGLEWCVNVVRAATQADEDRKRPEDESGMGDMELDPMLTKGAQFTKHGLKGVTRRWIKCRNTHIFWLKKEDSDLEECVDPIAWDSVSEILQGKQTLMFSRARAKNVQDSQCLSIVYRSDNRTLDLVADNEAQAFEWYGALNGYLMELKEKYAAEAAGRQEYTDKELEAAKAALEAERKQHEEAKAQLDDEKLKTQSELEAVRARRAELLKTMKNKESEMDRMKAMMAEQKDQLRARIKDLHEQVKALTTQLEQAFSQHQVLLTQLQEGRSDKAELAVVRAEIKRIKESRQAQAQEITALLTVINSKFGAFHKGITESDS